MIYYLITILVSYMVFSFFLKQLFNINLFKYLKYIPSLLWTFIASIWDTIVWIFYFIWKVFAFFLIFFSEKGSNSHSASFLTGWDRFRLINKSNKGLVVEKNGRITEKLSFQHLMVISPSGGGKTVSFVIPNVLALDNASMVVTDPSGEIYALTSQAKIKQGFKVKIFDVTDLKRSVRYNPLQRIESYSDIAKISSILIDSAFPNSDPSSAFWNDSAKLIVSITIRMLKAKHGSNANLRMVYEHLNYYNTDKQKELDILASEHLDDSSFQEYKSFMAQDIKVLSSVLSTAKSALSKLSDPDIAELTSSDTLDIESLREKKTILYMIFPEIEVKYFSFLISLLNTQLYHFAMKEKRFFNNYLAIHFLNEEFANIGVTPSFSTLVTTLRKRKCSLVMIIQDYQQIYHLYGKMDGDTIISNANTKIYLPGLSLHTISEIERSLGKIRKKIIDKKGYEKEDIQPLLHLDQIRMLPNNKAIMLSKNYPPVMLNLTPFFKNRKLKKLLKL